MLTHNIKWFMRFWKHDLFPANDRRVLSSAKEDGERAILQFKQGGGKETTKAALDPQ